MRNCRRPFHRQIASGAFIAGDAFWGIYKLIHVSPAPEHECRSFGRVIVVVWGVCHCQETIGARVSLFVTWARGCAWVPKRGAVDMGKLQNERLVGYSKVEQQSTIPRAPRLEFSSVGERFAVRMVYVGDSGRGVLCYGECIHRDPSLACLLAYAGMVVPWCASCPSEVPSWMNLDTCGASRSTLADVMARGLQVKRYLWSALATRIAYTIALGFSFRRGRPAVEASSFSFSPGQFLMLGIWRVTLTTF